MKCPKCKSEKKVKAGTINGTQRYKCKDCGAHYTVEIRRQKYSQEAKRKALFLYLEGVSTRKIEKLLGVNHTTLLKWIGEFGLKFALMNSKEKISVVEMNPETLNIQTDENCKWILVMGEEGSVLYTKTGKKSIEQSKYSSGTLEDTSPPKQVRRKSRQKR